MKTPSRTFIVIVLALIAISSAVVFQACAKRSDNVRDDHKFFLHIGKDPDNFAEFKDDPKEGKDRFDAVLRRLPSPQDYRIRYKKDAGTGAIDPYSPPPKPDVSLKTDNVTTAALAKNEPTGDPSVTKKVQSNDLADIQDVVNSLKN